MIPRWMCGADCRFQRSRSKAEALMKERYDEITQWEKEMAKDFRKKLAAHP
jgi:hypothetical protein